MLLSPIQFFKNLPKKRCSSCKKVMVEQADCYTNKCEKCSTVI
ncbi:YhfH family protein [Filobacillus milosensis]|uniref:YhfH family protein n=1 Tax=Filobacillus milosensis TaxID=94137 RepID=A0A4Y8ILF4_9BACI|nr:protein YhfH [Filobacillus milosensis]TFB22073.1 YhfH family protein [Filobacillus milosensis]